MQHANLPSDPNECTLSPPRSRGSRRGLHRSSAALRSADGIPRRPATALRTLQVIGVSLLALAVGGAAPSWAQTLPPCLATDAAITGVSPAPSDVSGLVDDCSALLGVILPLIGTAAIAPSGWIRTTAIDTWEYIELTADNSRVAKFEIPNHSPKFNGTIPDLSALTGLEVLDLERNELTGSIPDLSALTNLTKLHLQRNMLTGTVPDLSALTNLEIFRFNDNSLTGNLPQLSTFTNLQHFNAGRNQLEGAIPALTGLTKLERFNVEVNRLTGQIPALTGLVELNRFDASDNGLTGPIPALSGLTKLATLNLSSPRRAARGIGNQLDGPIPSLEGLGALRDLFLSDNMLEGPIPTLEDLGALEDLFLSNNRLTGAFPNLSSLTSLERLYLDRNQLTGDLPGEWPAASANLVELNVQSNGLTGVVPDVTPLAALEDLHLASNAFTGSIPAGLTNLSDLEELSLCFNDFTATETLDALLFEVSVLGCIRIDEENVSGAEGASMTFNVTHSSWPRRERHGLYVRYRTVDQTATDADYEATNESFLTIPAMEADEFMKSAAITVNTRTDSEQGEPDETFLLNLLNVYELTSPQGTASGNTFRTSRWTATGTILAAAPPPPPPPEEGPDPDPIPDPDPEPDPEPDPDPGPDPAACDRLVAPYWRGTGGIAVEPTNGRSAVFRHTCRGAQTTETLYANEAGLIVQLLSRDACMDDSGKEISTEVSVEGVEDGGWYWIDGGRNAAVAPLVCEVQLGGARAAVPSGVSTDATADATLFEHHATRLLGIVPHLQTPASGACSEYVAPYWKGTGGLVVKATDGESAVLTNTCGGVSETQTLKANDAGLIVQLLGEGDSSCTDGAGKALRSDVSVAGVEPGGWYWLNGARNSAVAPLACADHLGGSKATVPAGVEADATAAGTLFEHHVAKLIGIVPHLRRQE